MPSVPLGLKAYARAAAYVPSVVLYNLCLEKDESGASPDNTLRIQRPGLAVASTLPQGPVRALGYSPTAGAQVAVAGSNAYVAGVGAGVVPGQGPVPLVSTPFADYLLAEGVVYALTNGALTALALPDGRLAQDIDQLNGYLIVGCPDGRFYWLVPGAIAVQALDYATAESNPDGLVAVRRLNDELWLLGAVVTEVWQPTGDADAPFQRVSGRYYERGCLHRDSVRRFDNTLAWVGDDHLVYRGSSTPVAIGDASISEAVRGATGPCTAWVLSGDQHKWYALTVPGQGTYVYDASVDGWAQWGSAGQQLWQVQCGYELGGVTYGAGAAAQVYTVSAQHPTDAGVPFLRAVTGSVALYGVTPRNDSCTVGVGAAAPCVVRVRWRDGTEPWPAYYEELTVDAGSTLATVYRLGQPDQPSRTFEVSTLAATAVRFSGLVANESWK